MHFFCSGLLWARMAGLTWVHIEHMFFVRVTTYSGEKRTDMTANLGSFNFRNG